jgi:hypothetical protein
MPSKVTGLSQVLELFNIRIRVSGKRAKALFYLKEVSEGEGGMDLTMPSAPGTSQRG